MDSNFSRLGRTSNRRSKNGSVRRRPRRGSRRPKLIAALLLLGTVVIGGGSVFAATRPTWTPPASPGHVGRGGSQSVGEGIKTHNESATATAIAAPSRSGKQVSAKTRADRAGVSKPRATAKAGSHHAPAPAPATASSPPITYTVKSGDTLSGIAEWFRLHGYGALYRANMAVIGADPNLIIPGQRITIARGEMSMRGPVPAEGRN